MLPHVHKGLKDRGPTVGLSFQESSEEKLGSPKKEKKKKVLRCKDDILRKFYLDKKSDFLYRPRGLGIRGQFLTSPLGTKF
jgi:hypothetical protein